MYFLGSSVALHVQAKVLKVFSMFMNSDTYSKTELTDVHCVVVVGICSFLSWQRHAEWSFAAESHLYRKRVSSPLSNVKQKK